MAWAPTIQGEHLLTIGQMCTTHCARAGRTAQPQPAAISRAKRSSNSRWAPAESPGR